jgi:hypothetical protein
MYIGFLIKEAKMKIKLFFTIISLLLILKSSIGQNYPPLIKNSCWYIFVTTFSQPYSDWIIPEKDTIIGSYTYKKFIDSSRHRLVDFIREDALNKKVFKYTHGGEVTLFDFSLTLSDTITLGNGYKYQVTKVDSFIISPGIKRKWLTLQKATFGGAEEDWIEGVGTPQHPLKNFFELPSDPSYQLNCSYQNGIALYNRGGGTANGCNPTCCPTPPIVTESNKYTGKWFPNPFFSETTFLSDIVLKNATIVVYNTSGQQVRQIKNIKSQSITLNRENLPCGLYFVRILEENKVFPVYRLLILNN